jgi:V/A-type H+-transporting ATPase subunit E
MGLENIVDEILEQARSEVAAIKAEADNEANAMINQAKTEAEKIKETHQVLADAQIERMHKQEMSSAHLEIKRANLNAKKDVLNSTIQSAKEIISSLSAEKNANLLKEILDKYGSEGTRVYSNGRDAKLVQEMTDLTFMGEIDCIGGLIIENDDGTVRLDYTFDTILDDTAEQSLKQISDILFG